MSSKEEQYARVKRKLSYKMPVTFRWSLLSGFLIGVVRSLYSRKRNYMLSHTLGFGVAGGLGLCYNDFYRIWEIYRQP